MCLSFPNAPEKLTSTELRILEYIEHQREAFLFMTIGQLAQQLNVSEATISRFVRHMGCADFKQFKALVLEQSAVDGPSGKLARTLSDAGEFTLGQYLARQQQCLERTAENLDEAVFQRAVAALAGARRVFIHAKSASASLGQLLFFRLRRLGLDVSLLPSGGSEIMEGLARAEAGDLVVLFSFSKVSWEGRAILELQKRAGYQTLAFTSRLHIPEEEQADIDLFVDRGQEREYHSMTAAAAVVDALVVALSRSLGAEGTKHLNYLHDLKSRIRP